MNSNFFLQFLAVIGMTEKYYAWRDDVRRQHRNATSRTWRANNKDKFNAMVKRSREKKKQSQSV